MVSRKTLPKAKGSDAWGGSGRCGISEWGAESRAQDGDQHQHRTQQGEAGVVFRRQLAVAAIRGLGKEVAIITTTDSAPRKPKAGPVGHHRGALLVVLREFRAQRDVGHVVERHGGPGSAPP